MNKIGTVTQFFDQYDPDDPKSFNKLWSLMYDELHTLAHYMLQEKKVRAGRTLNTTALVHECYLKLYDAERLDLKNREHFYRVARKAMRELIVDYARAATRQKRGGGAVHISLEDAMLLFPSPAAAEEVLMIHEALERFEILAENSGGKAERVVQVVEYRYFMGFTIEETADRLDVGPRTVRRDFEYFKAWVIQHNHGAETPA